MWQVSANPFGAKSLRAFQHPNRDISRRHFPPVEGKPSGGVSPARRNIQSSPANGRLNVAQGFLNVAE